MEDADLLAVWDEIDRNRAAIDPALFESMTNKLTNKLTDYLSTGELIEIAFSDSELAEINRLCNRPVRRDPWNTDLTNT